MNTDDLWVPFFTLLKRYWDPDSIRILLSVEPDYFDYLRIKAKERFLKEFNKQ